MLVKNYRDVEANAVKEGAERTKIREVITEEEGAPHFTMRVFEIEPEGHTPLHAHDWEHEVFVLSGKGAVVGEGGEQPLRPGDVVFVPGEEEHQFRNTGETILEIICLIPIF